MTKPNNKPSGEDLGKMLVNIYESGYLDHTKAYKISFLKGIVAGLGGVIGATIVVAILIWILSFFSDISIINSLKDSLQSTK